MSSQLAVSAGAAALQYSRSFDAKSILVQSLDEPKTVDQLDWDDLIIGKLLGSGAFSLVNEVKFQRCSSHGHEIDAACKSEKCDLEYNKDDLYVIKHLTASVRDNKESFEKAAIDLANEAKLLQYLEHENIIKLHAVTKGCISESFMNSRSFFLIIDRLSTTVDQSIRTWKLQEQAPSKLLPRLRMGGPSPSQRARAAERIHQVMVPVATAMLYLHTNRVVFRDLKPSNVGFNSKGTLKIFDFGLAREIVDEDRKLTGLTGSTRYMAPEVAKQEPYGFPVDVYSFGIFLWEIVTLQSSFANMDRSEHEECVVYGGYRPPVEGICGSSQLRKLISSCWDASPAERPTFTQVKVSLELELSSDPSQRGRPSLSVSRSVSKIVKKAKGGLRRGNSTKGYLKAQSTLSSVESKALE